MDTYDYVVLSKSDFMRERHVPGGTQDCVDVVFEFDAHKFEEALLHHGQEGFRVIEKIYNSSQDWVLILSRFISSRGGR